MRMLGSAPQEAQAFCPGPYRAPDETRRNPKCRACGKCDAVRRLALDTRFDGAVAASYSGNPTIRTAAQAAA